MQKDRNKIQPETLFTAKFNDDIKTDYATPRVAVKKATILKWRVIVFRQNEMSKCKK